MICLVFGTEVIKGWWVLQIIDVIMLELPEMVDTELLECLELEKDGGLSILFLPIKFLMGFVLEIWYSK